MDGRACNPQDSVDRMIWDIEIGTGNKFYFLGLSGTAEDEVLARLGKESTEGRIAPLLVLCLNGDAGLPNIIRHLERVQPLAPPLRQVVVVRSDMIGDELRREWNRALVILNIFRNRVMEDCPHAVIFAGPPWLPQAARENAPDVWSIRAGSSVLPPAPLA